MTPELLAPSERQDDDLALPPWAAQAIDRQGQRVADGRGLILLGAGFG